MTLTNGRSKRSAQKQREDSQTKDTKRTRRQRERTQRTKPLILLSGCRHEGCNPRASSGQATQGHGPGPGNSLTGASTDLCCAAVCFQRIPSSISGMQIGACIYSAFNNEVGRCVIRSVGRVIALGPLLQGCPIDKTPGMCAQTLTWLPLDSIFEAPMKVQPCRSVSAYC